MVRVVDFALNEQDVAAATALSSRAALTRPPTSRGVFSDYPAATPKWAGRGAPAEDDFRNTMARMFIELGASELNKFLASVEMSSPDSATGESRILASVLAGPRDANRGTGYIDFLLQDVQMPHQEKSQIVETLADNYVIYYFGQAAVPFTFSGTVLNTVEDDQAINMLRIYRDMLRGTQLARRRKLLRIRFNGMIVAGSAMSLQLGMTAESEMSLSFSLQVMPKTVTMLPSTEFGVEILTDASGDPVYDEPVERAVVPTAARLTTPAASNVAGNGATTAPGKQNELGPPTEAQAAGQDIAAAIVASVVAKVDPTAVGIAVGDAAAAAALQAAFAGAQANPSQ